MVYEFSKRALDLSLSLVGICVLSPLMLLISLVILIRSGSPVVYRGLRTGRYGKPFRILKFRTMILESERPGGDTTALNDPRITSVGALLRKTKLDELPQLLNVLKGEMSLVGPRPELPAYTERYTEEEMRILSVRPGITDFSTLRYSNLAEVVGESNANRVFEEEIFPNKNELRAKYVDERSMKTDLEILFKTVSIVLRNALTKGL